MTPRAAGLGVAAPGGVTVKDANHAKRGPGCWASPWRWPGRRVSRFQSGVMSPHSTGAGGAGGREIGCDGEFTR